MISKLGYYSVIFRLRNISPVFVRKMSVDISQMRLRYKDKSETFLEKHLVSKEPFEQFKVWFDEACSRKDLIEPNAMCLATVSKEGHPSARFVLCKGFGKDGFKFFTNYESRKAKEMDENPNVAATFYWNAQNRSIRIEGTVDKLSEEESTDYFHQRPVPSKVAAVASRQSTPIQSRDVLCERESVLEQKYMIPGIEVPRPSYCENGYPNLDEGLFHYLPLASISSFSCPHLIRVNMAGVPQPIKGGYIIRPTSVEFWQGQRDRLHDRIKFRRPNKGEVPDGVLLHQGTDGWVYERLSP